MIKLVEAGKCTRVKWNEDSIMSIENVDHLVLEKEVPKKKKFELWIQTLNLEWQVTSNLKQYLLQMSLQLQVTLLLYKLSLINTILVNNIVIIIIIYEIFESSSHIFKAYSNKNV